MGTRVLVVDDDIHIAETLQDVLNVAGFTVDTASNAAEALRKIWAGVYDALVCDIMMPHLNGIGLYEELRRLGSPLVRRTVFIRGVHDPKTDDFFTSTGCRVMDKPFVLKELVATLRALS